MSKVLSFIIDNNSIEGTHNEDNYYIKNFNDDNVVSSDNIYALNGDVDKYGAVNLNDFHDTSSAFTIEFSLSDDNKSSSTNYNYMTIGRKTYSKSRDAITIGVSEGNIVIGVITHDSVFKCSPLINTPPTSNRSKFQFNYDPNQSVKRRCTLYKDSTLICNLQGLEDAIVNILDFTIYFGTTGTTNEIGYQNKMDLAKDLKFYEAITLYSGVNMNTTKFEHFGFSNLNNPNVICNNSINEVIFAKFRSTNDSINPSDLLITLTNSHDSGNYSNVGTFENIDDGIYTYSFSNLDKMDSTNTFINYNVQWLANSYVFNPSHPSRIYIDSIIPNLIYEINDINDSSVELKITSITDGNFFVDNNQNDFNNYSIIFRATNDTDPSDYSIKTIVPSSDYETIYKLDNLISGKYYNVTASISDSALNINTAILPNSINSLLLKKHYTNTKIRTTDNVAPGNFNVNILETSASGDPTFTIVLNNISDNSVDSNNTLRVYTLISQTQETKQEQERLLLLTTPTEYGEYVTTQTLTDTFETSLGQKFIADKEYFFYSMIVDSDNNKTISDEKVFKADNIMSFTNLISNNTTTDIADSNDDIIATITTKYNVISENIYMKINTISIPSPSIQKKEPENYMEWNITQSLTINSLLLFVGYLNVEISLKKDISIESHVENKTNSVFLQAITPSFPAVLESFIITDSHTIMSSNYKIRIPITNDKIISVMNKKITVEVKLYSKTNSETPVNTQILGTNILFSSLPDIISFQDLGEAETYDVQMTIVNALNQQYTIQLHDDIKTTSVPPTFALTASLITTLNNTLKPTMHLTSLLVNDLNSSYDVFVAAVNGIKPNDSDIEDFFTNFGTNTKRFENVTKNITTDVLINPINIDEFFIVEDTAVKVNKIYDLVTGEILEIPTNITQMTIIGLIRDRSADRNIKIFSDTQTFIHNLFNIQITKNGGNSSIFVKTGDEVTVSFQTKYNEQASDIVLNWFSQDQIVTSQNSNNTLWSTILTIPADQDSQLLINNTTFILSSGEVILPIDIANRSESFINTNITIDDSSPINDYTITAIHATSIDLIINSIDELTDSADLVDYSITFFAKEITGVIKSQLNITFPNVSDTYTITGLDDGIYYNITASVIDPALNTAFDLLPRTPSGLQRHYSRTQIRTIDLTNPNSFGVSFIETSTHTHPIFTFVLNNIADNAVIDSDNTLKIYHLISENQIELSNIKSNLSGTTPSVYSTEVFSHTISNVSQTTLEEDLIADKYYYFYSMIEDADQNQTLGVEVTFKADNVLTIVSVVSNNAIQDIAESSDEVTTTIQTKYVINEDSISLQINDTNNESFVITKIDDNMNWSIKNSLSFLNTFKGYLKIDVILAKNFTVSEQHTKQSSADVYLQAEIPSILGTFTAFLTINQHEISSSTYLDLINIKDQDKIIDIMNKNVTVVANLYKASDQTTILQTKQLGTDVLYENIIPTINFQGLEEAETYDVQLTVTNALNQQYTIQLHNNIKTETTSPIFSSIVTIDNKLNNLKPTVKLNIFEASDLNTAFDIYMVAINGSKPTDIEIGNFFETNTLPKQFDNITAGESARLDFVNAEFTNAHFVNAHNFLAADGRINHIYDFSTGNILQIPSNITEMTIIGIIQDKSPDANTTIFSHSTTFTHGITDVNIVKKVNPNNTNSVKTGDFVTLSFNTIYNESVNHIKANWFNQKFDLLSQNSNNTIWSVDLQVPSNFDTEILKNNLNIDITSESTVINVNSTQHPLLFLNAPIYIDDTLPLLDYTITTINSESIILNITSIDSLSNESDFSNYEVTFSVKDITYNSVVSQIIINSPQISIDYTITGLDNGKYYNIVASITDPALNTAHDILTNAQTLLRHYSDTLFRTVDTTSPDEYGTLVVETSTSVNPTFSFTLNNINDNAEVDSNNKLKIYHFVTSSRITDSNEIFTKLETTIPYEESNNISSHVILTTQTTSSEIIVADKFYYFYSMIEDADLNRRLGQEKIFKADNTLQLISILSNNIYKTNIADSTNNVISIIRTKYNIESDSINVEINDVSSSTFVINTNSDNRNWIISQSLSHFDTNFSGFVEKKIILNKDISVGGSLTLYDETSVYLQAFIPSIPGVFNLFTVTDSHKITAVALNSGLYNDIKFVDKIITAEHNVDIEILVKTKTNDVHYQINYEDVQLESVVAIIATDLKEAQTYDVEFKITNALNQTYTVIIQNDIRTSSIDPVLTSLVTNIAKLSNSKPTIQINTLLVNDANSDYDVFVAAVNGNRPTDADIIDFFNNIDFFDNNAATKRFANIDENVTTDVLQGYKNTDDFFTTEDSIVKINKVYNIATGACTDIPTDITRMTLIGMIKDKSPYSNTVIFSNEHIFTHSISNLQLLNVKNNSSLFVKENDQLTLSFNTLYNELSSNIIINLFSQNVTSFTSQNNNTEWTISLTVPPSQNNKFIRENLNISLISDDGPHNFPVNPTQNIQIDEVAPEWNFDTIIISKTDETITLDVQLIDDIAFNENMMFEFIASNDGLNATSEDLHKTYITSNIELLFEGGLNSKKNITITGLSPGLDYYLSGKLYDNNSNVGPELYFVNNAVPKGVVYTTDSILPKILIDHTQIPSINSLTINGLQVGDSNSVYSYYVAVTDSLTTPNFLETGLVDVFSSNNIPRGQISTLDNHIFDTFYSSSVNSNLITSGTQYFTHVLVKDSENNFQTHATNFTTLYPEKEENSIIDNSGVISGLTHFYNYDLLSLMNYVGDYNLNGLLVGNGRANYIDGFVGAKSIFLNKLEGDEHCIEINAQSINSSRVLSFATWLKSYNDENYKYILFYDDDHYLGIKDSVIKMKWGPTQNIIEIPTMEYTSMDWNHICLTIDTNSKKIQLFWNASLISTLTNPPSIAHVDGLQTKFYIGGQGTVSNFKGVLDDTRIYEILLTQDDVGLLYANGGNILTVTFDETNNLEFSNSLGSLSQSQVAALIRTEDNATGGSVITFDGDTTLTLPTVNIETDAAGIINESTISFWIQPTSDTFASQNVIMEYFANVGFTISIMPDGTVQFDVVDNQL
jgi:hypothetical protein